MRLDGIIGGSCPVLYSAVLGEALVNIPDDEYRDGGNGHRK